MSSPESGHDWRRDNLEALTAGESGAAFNEPGGEPVVPMAEPLRTEFRAAEAAGPNARAFIAENPPFRTPEVTPANLATGEIELSETCSVTPDVAQTLVSAAPRLISAFPALAETPEEGRDESLSGLLMSWNEDELTLAAKNLLATDEHR